MSTTPDDAPAVLGLSEGLGVWWGAQDVLSDHMRKCLDEALQRKIAEEHREAKSAWRARPCADAECCYHGKARATSCACSRA